MDVPLELSFHNIDASEVVERKVREKVAKLEKIYDRLVSCRVAVGMPHKHHRKGNIGVVRIEMSVPGDHLVVSSEPHRPQEKYHDVDIYKSLYEAFDAAERKLKAFKARQLHSQEPNPEGPLLGNVANLPDGEPYGFLKTLDGRELYFHRNAVANDKFDALEVGDMVEYEEELGATGPQARRVWSRPNERTSQ